MKKAVGWCLLAFVAAVVLGWYLLSLRAKPLTARGRTGSSTMGFLHDPAVQRLLRQRYHLVVQAQEYGSIAMVTEPAKGFQFLWPGSDLALAYYYARGGELLQSRKTFHSPLVLYAWDVVTEGLRTHGIVDKRGETYYVTDFAKLLELIESQTTWAAFGLPQLYGSIKIITTDPTKSNSGVSFVGLLANLMNGGDVVTSTDEPRLATLQSRLQGFFGRLGLLEQTSDALWDKFLSTGAGAYPLIVGYENQIIEHGIEHPEVRDVLSQQVRVLYPQPTVWNSHPFIALDTTGLQLLQALQDMDLQRLAWERHGLRTRLQEMTRDVASLAVPGVPAAIDATIPTPTVAVMQWLLKGLSTTRYKVPRRE